MECQTSALNYHQRNTKMCLKIQGKEIDTRVQCEYCNKVLSSKSSQKRHMNKCSSKYLYLEDELYDTHKEIDLLNQRAKKHYQRAKKR